MNNIIAIQGVPAKFSLIDVMKNLAQIIGGPFETLNFAINKHNIKTCYLRLSERLDPVQVARKISSTPIGNKALRFNAFIPDSIPDLQLPEKKRKIPMKIRDKLKMPELELPHEVIINTHHEVFLEIQYKYPGLYNLSRKTAHKLLDGIARKIGDRLTHVMDANIETRECSFLLSKYYRKTHPHFGDFQLILSTLHQLQDAAGAPRAQIQESDLLSTASTPQMINNVPLETVKVACNKYGDQVVAAVSAHVAALDSELQPGDSEEQVARKKVREELKKIMPFMPAALKQVIVGHFVPEEQKFRRIRIYGEPYLPSRQALEPFTNRYVGKSPARFVRSRRMYNLLMFRVPNELYAPLRAMDATIINGAKLTIRSEVPVHEVCDVLRAELAAYYGGTPRRRPRDEDDYDDEHDDHDDQDD